MNIWRCSFVSDLRSSQRCRTSDFVRTSSVNKEIHNGDRVTTQSDNRFVRYSVTFSFYRESPQINAQILAIKWTNGATAFCPFSSLSFHRWIRTPQHLPDLKKADIALNDTPSQSYGTSLAIIRSHNVTCHPTEVNAPRLTPAVQAGTWFTYPGGTEGWVDLVDLIAPRPGVEPATFRSHVRRRTAAPPRQLRRQNLTHSTGRFRRLLKTRLFSDY